MEANKIFNDILHYAENSRLNFSMSRTPFSATISLKRSFTDDKQSVYSKTQLSRSELETTVDKLSADNEEMKMKLQKVENDFYEAEQKKVKAEELYKMEKENNKAATEVEGQFRSELLKLKLKIIPLNTTFKPWKPICQMLATKKKQFREKSKI